MSRRKNLTIGLVTGVILIVAIAWLHIWARQSEEQTRKGEACYRQGIAMATDALDGLRTDLAVLAGKVQERGDREGEQAAIHLWADGLEEILDKRQAIVKAMSRITAPERYHEFHRLLIERETRQNEFQSKVLLALRADDEFREKIEKLQSEEDTFQERLDQRIIEAARNAGLAVP